MSTPPLSPSGVGSTTSTQEIPVVPAAVPNTQHLPPPPAADGLHPTGPVDFVPEPPAPTTAPTGKAFSGGSRRLAAGRSGPAAAGLAAAGLAALAVVALELGLSLTFGTRSFWSAIPLWSAFATLAAAAGLASLGLGAVAGPGLARRGAAPVYGRVATAAVCGLAVFWLLVVLPVADSDRGFLLTAALGLLGAGVWLSSRRSATAG